jgi:hypothetical protein
MMGGDDDDGDATVETQEISSENLFHAGVVVVGGRLWLTGFPLCPVFL